MRKILDPVKSSIFCAPTKITPNHRHFVSRPSLRRIYGSSGCCDVYPGRLNISGPLFSFRMVLYNFENCAETPERTLLCCWREKKAKSLKFLKFLKPSPKLAVYLQRPLLQPTGTCRSYPGAVPRSPSSGDGLLPYPIPDRTRLFAKNVNTNKQTNKQKSAFLGLIGL